MATEVVVSMDTPAETSELTEPVAETVTEAAVEIAVVEAERDITIAAIHAETEQAHIEARSNEGYEQCAERITELEASMQGLNSTLAGVQGSLAILLLSQTLSPLAEPEGAETPPLIAEEALVLPASESLEVTPESPVAQEPPAPRARVRLV